MAIKEKIRVRLKSYDHVLIDTAAKKIVEVATRNGAEVSGPIPLPTEKEIITILRAVHKYKDSREQFEPMNELDYSRMIDARDHFQPGNRILVKVMELDTSDQNRIQVALSIKRTKPNPYDTLNEKFIVGNHYIGTVTNLTVGGVFVALDAGVDCLCVMPIRGIPMIGARVTVRLTRINQEERKLSGVIVHTSYFPR